MINDTFALICKGKVEALLRIGEGGAALAEGLGGPHSSLHGAHLLCHVLLRRSASQGPTLWSTMT